MTSTISDERKYAIGVDVGVRFDILADGLAEAFSERGITPLWWSTDAALKTPEETDRLTEPFLGGDDPIFGFRTTLELEDFFDMEKLGSIRPDSSARLNIIYGIGAALAHWDGLLVYVDIPKNEIQFRARAGSIKNLGAAAAYAPKMMYKRFYFVDWPVLNRHKKALLPEMDVIVDAQRETTVTWAMAEDVRRGHNAGSVVRFPDVPGEKESRR